MLSVEQKDFTQSFRQLCHFDMYDINHSLRDQFIHRERFDKWAQRYVLALTKQGQVQKHRQQTMRRSNPMQVLHNYLAQQVIEQAETGDFDMFEKLAEALRARYDDLPAHSQFANPPSSWVKKLDTSCCS